METKYYRNKAPKIIHPGINDYYLDLIISNHGKKKQTHSLNINADHYLTKKYLSMSKYFTIQTINMIKKCY